MIESNVSIKGCENVTDFGLIIPDLMVWLLIVRSQIMQKQSQLIMWIVQEMTSVVLMMRRFPPSCFELTDSNATHSEFSVRYSHSWCSTHQGNSTLNVRCPSVIRV